MKTEKKVGMALFGILMGIGWIYKTEKKEKEEKQKQELINKGRQAMWNNFGPGNYEYEEVSNSTEIVK